MPGGADPRSRPTPGACSGVGEVPEGGKNSSASSSRTCRMCWMYQMRQMCSPSTIDPVNAKSFSARQRHCTRDLAGFRRWGLTRSTLSGLHHPGPAASCACGWRPGPELSRCRRPPQHRQRTGGIADGDKPTVPPLLTVHHSGNTRAPSSRTPAGLHRAGRHGRKSPTPPASTRPLSARTQGGAAAGRACQRRHRESPRHRQQVSRRASPPRSTCTAGALRWSSPTSISTPRTGQAERPTHPWPTRHSRPPPPPGWSRAEMPCLAPAPPVAHRIRPVRAALRVAVPAGGPVRPPVRTAW